jgi:hypothetical protein
MLTRYHPLGPQTSEEGEGGCNGWMRAAKTQDEKKK